MKAGTTVDQVIVGGGIAGLWLANLLKQRGHRIILLEAGGLGGGQTLASQGMIHGGLKYSLGGRLTRATRAITNMPARWRACLEGHGEIDLRALHPLSARFYLFADASSWGPLSTLVASKLFRGRVERLPPTARPAALAHFSGVVYAVDELVIDTRALVTLLHTHLAGQAYQYRLSPEHVEIHQDCVRVRLNDQQIRAQQMILCAGSGNGPLLDGMGIRAPAMQLRPLHQALVYHDYPHPLFAHCLTGLTAGEPRLTITTHTSPRGSLWYLGGQLATDGVAMTPAALAEHALAELRRCVGWVNWDQAIVETMQIQRAEAAAPHGQRPDSAFAAAQGPVLVCWPTKLTLAPDLGDRVLDLVAPPDPGDAAPLAPIDLPAASPGQAPWGV